MFLADGKMNIALSLPQAIAAKELKPFGPPSFGRPLAPLASSIAKNGLLHPVLVWDKAGQGPLVISGRRRLLVFIDAGVGSIPALFVPSGLTEAEVCALALAENFQRGWNAAEQALAWAYLESAFPPETAIELATELGLGQSPKMRQWCSKAALLPPEVLTALADERLDLETAARLSDWDAESLKAVWRIFESFNPSKQKKKQWLDWLEDVARRESMSPARILEDRSIAGALSGFDSAGRPAAENEARLALWRRRHPMLAALVEKREARVRSLKLPSSLRLEVDPALEDLKFGLNCSFTSFAEFQKLAERIEALASNEGFQSLVEGRDE